MITNAQTDPGCEGCQWRSGEPGAWCYMFDKAPKELPCAQHDRFEVQREVTQAALRRHPELLSLMIDGI